MSFHCRKLANWYIHHRGSVSIQTKSIRDSIINLQQALSHSFSFGTGNSPIQIGLADVLQPCSTQFRHELSIQSINSCCNDCALFLPDVIGDSVWTYYIIDIFSIIDIIDVSDIMCIICIMCIVFITFSAWVSFFKPKSQKMSSIRWKSSLLISEIFLTTVPLCYKRGSKSKDIATFNPTYTYRSIWALSMQDVVCQLVGFGLVQLYVMKADGVESTLQDGVQHMHCIMSIMWPISVTSIWMN